MEKTIEVRNRQTTTEGFYDENHDSSFEINYSDGDIMLIESAKEIVETAAVRTKVNSIVVCFAGSAQVEVNGKAITVERNQMLIMPANAKFENFLFSVDFKCKALLLTDSIIQRMLRPVIDIWNRTLYFNRMEVRQLREVDMEFADKICDAIKFCLDYGSNPYQTDVVQSFIQGGLMGLCGMLAQETEDEPQHRTSTGDLFPRFLDLLQNSKVKHRQVTDYAAQLFVSPKYLSIVCKQHSGKTALQWIEEYTLADVDYYLRSTNRSIKEVANLLGFPNASFFGKYVKEHLGVSPMVYRNQKADQAGQEAHS